MTDRIGTADCPYASEMLCDDGACPACDAATDAYDAFLVWEEQQPRPPYVPPGPDEPPF
ncbi:hypothetical protein [Iamia sp.]|uniref:hypothetical protein n=1 Tax=Iamia sp. TaxID=2722710 RepID=UPI002CBDD528|nr:hypothetical protein [Iamia sp.]HXH56594.1 hypothetical protein [Iamia sp.]